MILIVAFERHHAIFAAREMLNLRQHEWRFIGHPIDLRGLYQPEVVIVNAPRYQLFMTELDNRSEIRNRLAIIQAKVREVILP